MKEQQPTPSTVEKSQYSELLGQQSVGLQARLLLDGFSNRKLEITKQKIQPIQKFGIQGVEPSLMNLYQKASVNQRIAHQEKTGLTYEKWKGGFDTYLQKIRGDTDRSERKTFLETIGLNDATHADEFYGKYLKGKSDIMKFVYDVEALATSEQIREHEDIIRGIGNTFGYASSEVIEHLIQGVRNVKEHPDRFIKAASEAANQQDVIEHPLLGTVFKDGGREKEAPKVQVVEREAEKEPPPKPKQVQEEQLFPAPKGEPRRDDSPLKANEIAMAVDYLLYNDVDPKDKRIQAERIRQSEVMKYYTRELGNMMQEYGHDFVLDKAGDAISQLQDGLKLLGMRGTPYSKSRSWYLWHAAKSRFLENNPDIAETFPNSQFYTPFDPLLQYQENPHPVDKMRSRQAELDIMWSMLGFEVYLKRKKRKNIWAVLDPAMPGSERQLLNSLLDEKPKPNGPESLSTYKLREIGRIMRQYRKRQ